jgi:hypothetical protein
MTRDPLTERIVHELREINPDPKDWFEGPITDDRPLWQRRPWNRWDGLVAFLLVLISCAVSFGVLWLIWHWLSS